MCTFLWHVLKVHYQGFIISNNTKQNYLIWCSRVFSQMFISYSSVYCSVQPWVVGVHLLKLILTFDNIYISDVSSLDFGFMRNQLKNIYTEYHEKFNDNCHYFYNSVVRSEIFSVLYWYKELQLSRVSKVMCSMGYG